MNRPSIIRGKYTLRPWRYSDLDTLAALDLKAFTPPHSQDNLFEVLFPGYEGYADTTTRIISNIFKMRYFSREFVGRVLHDQQGNVVAYTIWKRPVVPYSVLGAWLSPRAWYNWFGRLCSVTIPMWLRPLGMADPPGIGAMSRTMAPIEEQILNTPRRQQAWYLSKVTVEPKEQGRGWARVMIDDGLKDVDAEGAAVWLVGMKGLDVLYNKFGFKTLARANVGELKSWDDSGYVMMRE